MRGLHLHPGTSPERIVKNDDGSVTLYAKTKDGKEVVETADHVLMATGRKPNTHNLGLEQVPRLVVPS
jgi:pyruvate/2-oxoglutarate dehydrogenase complex dihydrolipoamide dehydrogenase (E3) component